MRLTVERDALAEAWALVAAAAEGKAAASPLLRCVRLRAAGGTLSLAATDGEVCAQAEAAGAEVEAPGEALVDAAKGKAILSCVQDREVRLRAEGNVFVVGSDSRASFEMPSQDPAAWPEPPADDEGGAEAECDVLANLLEMTAFAAARGDGGMPACKGVALHLGGGGMLAVATDGKRLAVAGSGGAGRAALVPERAVKLLRSHLAGLPKGSPVQLLAGDTELTCRRPGAVLRTRLLSGRFPPWQQVMPKDDPVGVALVCARDLESAVRAAAVMTDPDDRRLAMRFSPVSGLVIETSSAREGRASVPLPLRYRGEDARVVLDHALLADFLKLAKDAELEVELRGPDRPVVLRRGPEWTYVVMPLTERGA